MFFQGELLTTLRDYSHPVYHVAASSDGALIAAAVAKGGKVDLRNWKTGQQLYEFKNLGSLVPHVTFSPDGNLLAMSSWTDALSLFDTQSHKLWMRVRPGGGIHWSQFLSNQQWLAVATNGPRVYAFPIGTRADKKTKLRIEKLLDEFKDDSYAVREQASKELAAIGPAAESQLQQATKSSFAEVRWRSRVLRRLLGQPESAIQLEGHTSKLECVAFSPDSKLLASGDDTGQIKIWRVEDWSVVATLSIAEQTAR